MIIKKEVLRVVLIIALMLILISPVIAVLGNHLPTLTITSMNLNPGTSRDINSYIEDADNDKITCTYCIDDKCYSVCRIYAPLIPGIHKITLYLNDTKEINQENITVFVPGEIPDKPVTKVIEQNFTETDLEKAFQNITENKTNETKTKNLIDNEKTELNVKKNNTDNETKIIYEEKLDFGDIMISILILLIIGAMIYFIEKKQKKQRTTRQQEIKYLGEIFPEDKYENNNENDDDYANKEF